MQEAAAQLLSAQQDTPYDVQVQELHCLATVLNPAMSRRQNFQLGRQSGNDSCSGCQLRGAANSGAVKAQFRLAHACMQIACCCHTLCAPGAAWDTSARHSAAATTKIASGPTTQHTAFTQRAHKGQASD